MRFLLVLVGFFLSNILYSQSQYPFPTRNVYWIDKYSSSAHLPGNHSCTLSEYRIVKDTTIFGLMYHKLSKTVYNSPTCLPNSFSFNAPVDAGFFRNDSLNKRVYYRSTPNAGFDELMYDFDLQLNDIYQGQMLVDPSVVLRVEKVDTILAFNKQLRRFTFIDTILPRFFLPKVTIEGMGGGYGFFGVLSNVTTVNNNNFFFEMCVNNFTWNGQPCNLITSLGEEIKENEFNYSIYYDSQANSLKLINSDKIRKIEIYGIQGAKLLSLDYPNESVVIKLPKSIYILRLTDINGKMLNKKIYIN